MSETKMQCGAWCIPGHECRREPGHDGPHETMNGHTWADPVYGGTDFSIASAKLWRLHGVDVATMDGVGLAGQLAARIAKAEAERLGVVPIRKVRAMLDEMLFEVSSIRSKPKHYAIGMALALDPVQDANLRLVQVTIEDVISRLVYLELQAPEMTSADPDMPF